MFLSLLATALTSPTLTSIMEPNLLPFVTQASDSSDSEEPMPLCPSYCVGTSCNSATTAVFLPAAADPTTPQHPPPTKRPLILTGLFGLKAIPCSKRIPVRQFKKSSGSKVRSHSRKPTARRRSSMSLKAKPPSLPKGGILGALVDAESSAKLINSMLIQDKLDQYFGKTIGCVNC